MIYRPNPGPQTQFVTHDSDILVYGGAAGSGKTRGALLDWSRYIRHSEARGVFFRRTYPQIKAGGGPWDEAIGFFKPIFGKKLKINLSTLDLTFPSGAQLSFRSMQHEKNVHDWQGSQLNWVCFDEATHFTHKQIFYLMSRLRSKHHLPTKMRMTCNPDAESWLASLISWWIDQNSGYPDPARGGTTRYMYVVNDTPMIYDTADKAMSAHPEFASDDKPLSITFIPGRIDDTPQLAGTGYKGKLLAQSEVERERLLRGNWKIVASDGLFQRKWFDSKFVDDAPEDIPYCRAWDLAATEPDDKNDPDYTVGALVGYDRKTGHFYIKDLCRDRLSPARMEELIGLCADMDGKSTTVCIPQDPGAAGKKLVSDFVRKLAGYRVHTSSTRGDKQTRAHAFATQAEHGNVYIVRRPWNQALLNELCRFPYAAKDDQVDAIADAVNFLTDKRDYSGLADLNKR